MPYPPEWSREYSPEILTFWERFSRHTWIRFYLVWRDEERQLAWRITALAGILAIVMVLLLFLDSLPARRYVRRVTPPALQVTKIVAPDVTTLAEIEPPLVEVSYRVEPAAYTMSIAETVTPAPVPAPVQINTPAFDPFEMFALPPAQATEEPKEPLVQTPVEPPAPSVPPAIFTREMPVIQLPDLQVHSVVTDLFPNQDFDERVVTYSEKSRVIGGGSASSIAGVPWKRALFDDSRHFADPVRSPVFGQVDHQLSAAELPVPPRSDDRTDLNRVIHKETHGDLLLTKNSPAEVAKYEKFSYTLTLKNQSQRTIDYVKVQEQTAGELTLLKFEPPVHATEKHFEWVVTALAPGEERMFKVTCQALEQQTSLQMTSTVDVVQTLASNTNVFVPDVVVELTLPVKVPTGETFPVQILVKNNSQKTFAASDLRVKLVKGVHQRGETDLTRRIDVPAPGQSLTIPMTITSRESGEAILEASLNLEKTLTVPVTAYTEVSMEEGKDNNTTSPSAEQEAKEPRSARQGNRIAISSL